MQYLHNPRCSKSRQGLALLKQHNVEPQVRLYLQLPLGKLEIEEIIKALDIADVKLMMRTKEPEFKQQALINATQQELIQAIIDTPKLLERPILVNGNRACIGRPPEDLLRIV
jgi:arsenate reductase